VGLIRSYMIFAWLAKDVIPSLSLVIWLISIFASVCFANYRLLKKNSYPYADNCFLTLQFNGSGTAA
jgi:hypothetical protein